MGAQVSRIAPSATSVAIDAYVAELGDVQYEGRLGNARFLKSIKGSVANDGLVVVKVFIKPTNDIQLKQIGHELQVLKDRVGNASNVMVYSQVIESERAGYLVRQYLKWNLYDRISTRPFLEHIEKLWIAFQLLIGLRNCHSRHVYHGDIKSENVLVTSWNWVYLTDFASFKPVYLPEDDPAQFSFFFDISRRRSCYVAPERLVPHNHDPHINSLTEAMDIFSLGCVIGELFLEGSPMFSLAQMFKYKKGEYSPPLDSIDDAPRKLIESMTSLNADGRLSAQQYLNNCRGSLFPDYFYFLHAYMENMVRPQLPFTPISRQTHLLLENDERINMIHRDYGVISDKLEFYKKTAGCPAMTTIANKTANSLLPIILDLPGTKRWTPKYPKPLPGRPDDGALMVLGIVCSAIRNTARASSRIRGCELLLALGEHVHDEAKLDRCVPHLLWLADDPDEIVAVAAIRSLTHLLGLVSSITPLNSHIFPEYILPRLGVILRRAPSAVRIAIAGCLGSLAETALRFVDMCDVIRRSGLLGRTGDEDSTGGGSNNNEASSADDIRTTFGSYESYDRERQEVCALLEEQVRMVVTDPDVEVRRMVLLNAGGLCLSLGRHKTNDVILSHAITYLNANNARLRLALFDCMSGIAPYVGSVSLEEYVVPLLMQSLADAEELVVHKVLNTFTVLSDLGLLRPIHVWQLVRSTVMFLVHPNGWIRHATAQLLSSTTRWMSAAQIFCELLPCLRPFLECDIVDVSPASIVLHCKPPLSRDLYVQIVSWAAHADKSAFWNISKYPVEGRRTADGRLQRQMPTSAEDDRWLARLKERGLRENQLWMLVVYREHIAQIVKVRTNEDSNQAASGYEKVDVVPQNVFFEASSSGPSSSSDLKAHESSPSKKEQTSVLTNVSQTVVSLPNSPSAVSLGLASAAPAQAVTGAQLTQVYGEMDGSPFSQTNSNNNHNHRALSSTYTGDDPYIQKMLESVYRETVDTATPEFGAQFLFSGTNAAAVEKTSPKKNGAPPLGLLVASFEQHDGRINCLAVSGDHTFFVTGSDDGTLKVWDTHRLEKSVINRAVQTLKCGSPVKSVCFIGYTYSLCCGLADGTVRFVRVDMAAKIGSSMAPRYKRLVQVKMINLATIASVGNGDATSAATASVVGGPDSDYAISLFCCESRLIIVTLTGRIILVDIRTLEITGVANNAVQHGVVTASATDSHGYWIVLGTTRGVVDLWDLRFLVHLRSWRVNYSEINNIVLHPKNSKWICVASDDLSIWDVESGDCKEVWRWGTAATGSNANTNNKPIDPMSIEDLDNDVDLDGIQELVKKLGMDEHVNQITCLCSVGTKGSSRSSRHFIFCGDSDKCVRYIDFNAEGGENNMIVSGRQTGQLAPQYTISYSGTRKIIVERASPDNPKTNSKKPRMVQIANEQVDLGRNHYAAITGVAFLRQPYEMVVSVDAAGAIKVFV